MMKMMWASLSEEDRSLIYVPRVARLAVPPQFLRGGGCSSQRSAEARELRRHGPRHGFLYEERTQSSFFVGQTRFPCCIPC